MMARFEVRGRSRPRLQSFLLLSLLLILVGTAARKVQVSGSNLFYIVDEDRFTWYLIPDTILKRNGIVYETNSFGLRELEFPLKASPGGVRIICLGDSVTYGAGIAFDQTYSQQLERELKKHRSDLRVINSGIGSHRAWHGLERLEKDVIRFDPDIVTICFGFNDGVLKPETLWEEWKQKLARAEPSRAEERPTHSTSTLPTGKIGKELVPSIPIEEYGSHLKAMIERLKETRARVYLVLFSTISDDYQRSEWPPEVRERQRRVYDRYRKRMRKVGREMGITVVDPHRRFAESKDSLILPDGIHPNARGMKVYAEKLYEQITADWGTP